MTQVRHGTRIATLVNYTCCAHEIRLSSSNHVSGDLIAYIHSCEYLVNYS